MFLRNINMWRMNSTRDNSTLESLLSPLEASKEATLSEFSFELEQPDSTCSSKKSIKYFVVGGFLAVLFVPMIVFLLLAHFQGQLDERETMRYKNGAPHIAITSCGPVEGIAKDGGYEYRGIPYTALLPDMESENSRWQPAASVSRLEHCWKDVLPYDPNPSECYQLSREGNVTGSDNCLTLDVYTPRSGYEDPSHVVVVLAVPDFTGGWPSDTTFKDFATPTAKFAAERDTVYVVPRFRLGPVGFLPRLIINETKFNPNITDFHEEIVNARNERESLERAYNLAISDIVAALSWIQLNIENFGGETRSVTLLGWGAGSSLVTALTSITNLPGYPFLFTQAWSIGGSGYPASKPAQNPDINPGFPLWENSPCNKGEYNPKCLFELSTEDLFKSIPDEWIGRNLNSNHQWLNPDSYWLQTSVQEAWNTGRITHDIPLIIGTASQEVFRFPDELRVNFTSLRSYVNDIRGNIPTDIFKTHTANDTILSQFITDIKYNCPLRQMAKNASKHFSSNVYFYVSNWTSPKSSSSSFSVGLNDLAAILGNTKDSTAASLNIQQLFFDFLHDAALPRHIPASSGVYIINDDVTISPTYSFCQIWELDQTWKKFAQLH